MAFDINTFKGEVNAGDGPMRDNLFEFRVMRDGGLSRYWADTVSFPGKLNQTHDVRRYGYGVVEKRPMVTNFTQIQVQFHNDNKNRVWGFLHDWMEDVIPHNLSTGTHGNANEMLVNYKDTYKEDIYIYVYDIAGKVRSVIQMVEAFPTQIGDVPLSWQNRDSHFRFNCSFDFLAWNVKAPDGDTPDVTWQVASQLPDVSWRVGTGDLPEPNG